MKITFYSSMNPKRLLEKSQYKSLADVVAPLSVPGEALELDAQQEQTYNNTIEVFRNLKLTGNFKATFELHGNINVVIDSATIANTNMDQYGTILLASDFSGSLSIINSKIEYCNGIGSYLAIWHESADTTNMTSITQSLYIKNSTIDGILDNPYRISMEGQVQLTAPALDAATWLSSANWQVSQAVIKAKYASFVNDNIQETQVKKIICLAGPVIVKGKWRIVELNLDLTEPTETFKFDGGDKVTNIKLHAFTKTHAPVGSSAFYCAHALLDLTNSKLGQANDHLQATITDTKLVMKHTIDNLTWQLEGINALDLDKASVTSLRQRQSEFTGALPSDIAKQQAASASTAEKATDTNQPQDNNKTENRSNNEATNRMAKVTTAKNDDMDKPVIKSNKLAKENIKQDGMSKLQAMIGLKDVKRKLNDYIEVAKFNVKAKKRGLQTVEDLNRHMIFGGNPGTGKTTVAKYVAQILHEQGALPSAKFTNVLASDLTKGYKSQTAEKTHKIVEDACGGVLLIDEAYTLGDTENTFSGEAVTQLLKELETHHNDLIIILAGYTDAMHKFMKKTNQGFASRFNNWIDFPDYTDDEKIQIFKKDCHDGGTICSNKIINNRAFRQLLLNFYSRDHANGRSVRNFYEALTQARINRVNPKMDQLTDEEVMTITAEDLKVVFQDAVKTLNREKKDKEREMRQKAQIQSQQKEPMLDLNAFDNNSNLKKES